MVLEPERLTNTPARGSAPGKGSASLTSPEGALQGKFCFALTGLFVQLCPVPGALPRAEVFQPFRLFLRPEGRSAAETRRGADETSLPHLPPPPPLAVLEPGHDSHFLLDRAGFPW